MSAVSDAVEVGLAIGLISAWSCRTLSNIFLAGLAREGRRAQRRRDAAVYVVVDRPKPPVTREDVRKATAAMRRAQKPARRPQPPPAGPIRR